MCQFCKSRRETEGNRKYGSLTTKDESSLDTIFLKKYVQYFPTLGIQSSSRGEKPDCSPHEFLPNVQLPDVENSRLQIVSYDNPV